MAKWFHRRHLNIVNGRTTTTTDARSLVCSKLCIQDCRLSSGIENSQYVNQVHVHSVWVHTICQDMSVLQLMSILYIFNDNFITKGTGSVTKKPTKKWCMHPEKKSDEPVHLQSLTRLANAWENVGHFLLAEHTAKTGQIGQMPIHMLLFVGC